MSSNNEEQADKQPEQKTQEIVCYNCGMKGHYATDPLCPTNSNNDFIKKRNVHYGNKNAGYKKYK